MTENTTDFYEKLMRKFAENRLRSIQGILKSFNTEMSNVLDADSITLADIKLEIDPELISNINKMIELSKSIDISIDEIRNLK